MKLESDIDLKKAASLISKINELTMNGFTVGKAYELIKDIEWIALAMQAYKTLNSPVPKPTANQPANVTSITTQKKKK